MNNSSLQESTRIQANILKLFSTANEYGISITEISNMLDIKRDVIKYELDQLREAGFVFLGIKKLTLKSCPSSIQPPMILSGLKAKKFAKEIYTFKTIGSTNDTAKRLAESGSPEGTLVTAEKQTKGKGRLGRNWYSPPGKGLYFSIILYPQIELIKIPALSQVAALAVCKVVQKLTNIETSVKWPNDCLLNGKKIAGILLESATELDRIAYTILGIGININTAKDEFSSKLRSTATSLAAETGREFDRVEILKSLLYELEKSYNSFTKYGLRFIGSDLVKKSAILGKKLTFKLNREKISGIALGFDENGALRVKAENNVFILSSGEVTLRK